MEAGSDKFVWNEFGCEQPHPATPEGGTRLRSAQPAATKPRSRTIAAFVENQAMEGRSGAAWRKEHHASDSHNAAAIKEDRKNGGVGL